MPFKELDRLFVESVPWLSEQVKGCLAEIDEMEDDLKSDIIYKKRMGYAINAEAQVRQKIMRLFVRHVYYPKSETDQAHFILWVEGSVINEKYRHLKFGNFFDRCRVNVDQKDKRNVSITNQTFEWSEDQFVEGSEADVYRVKVYSDGTKTCMATVSLTRNEDVIKRYDLPPKMRAIFPNIRVDPSEEEVLLALWMYATDFNLWAEKDKRFIKCDEALKDIFQLDHIMVSTLKTKVMKLLLPQRPIVIEHVLNPVNTEEYLTASNKISPYFTPAPALAQPNVNMRVLDIEIDVHDESAGKYIAELNALAKTEFDVNDQLAKLYAQQVFQLQQIQAEQCLISKLERELGVATAKDIVSGVASGTGDEISVKQEKGEDSAMDVEEPAIVKTEVKSEVKTEGLQQSTAVAGRKGKKGVKSEQQQKQSQQQAPESNEKKRDISCILSAEELRDPVPIIPPIDFYSLIKNRTIPMHRQQINLHKHQAAMAQGAAASGAAEEEGSQTQGVAESKDGDAFASSDNLGMSNTNLSALDSGSTTTRTNSYVGLSAGLRKLASKNVDTPVPLAPPSTLLPSTLHGLTGFVDIGDEKNGLFSGRYSEWVEHLAQGVLRKQDGESVSVQQEDSSMKVEEQEEDSNHPHTI